MSKVNPIPEGFSTVTPHIVVKGAAQAIEFYKKAFGAEEIYRMNGPDGQSVMHAEIRIGNSPIMIAEEWPMPNGPKAPTTLGGSAVTIHLYVPDVDASFKRATDAGATATMPPMDAFWGDRYGKLKDPFGHDWGMATHIEDVPPEEMPARMQKAFANMGDCGQ
ncbi:MAG TPA: VOC family protein [Phycisphaerae bacterium]|nr:VOC family protein [Phycisphaerae bacterium]HRW55806.1 VOC family protein [Phycisphaerae bacterium]